MVELVTKGVFSKQQMAELVDHSSLLLEEAGLDDEVLTGAHSALDRILAIFRDESGGHE